jgi:hypothetical protein
MGILQQAWKRLVSWTAEGVWQWIICYFIFTPGAWAGATVTLRHYGTPMITALLVGGGLAAPVALAIAFFRNHTKMMVIVRELQSKLPPAPADLKTQSGSTVPPRLGPIVILILAGLSVLLIVMLVRGPRDVSTPAVVVTPDAGTGPVAIFNGFDDVQKKILRTMWEHQSKMGYIQTWGLPIVTETPALPGYILPEYVEFYAHLEPLVKQGYVSCRYWEQLKHKYCILVDSGIILMSSIGDLIHGPPYILP